MNLSLTLNFNTIAELQDFLNSRTAGAASTVALVQPAATTEQPALKGTIEPATILPGMPGAQPAAAVVDPMAGLGIPANVTTIDPVVLKAALMDRLRALAGSQADPAVVGQFINNFGLAKFSDIADTDLVRFQAALQAQFPG